MFAALVTTSIPPFSRCRRFLKGIIRDIVKKNIFKVNTKCDSTILDESTMNNNDENVMDALNSIPYVPDTITCTIEDHMREQVTGAAHSEGPVDSYNNYLNRLDTCDSPAWSPSNTPNSQVNYDTAYVHLQKCSNNNVSFPELFYITNQSKIERFSSLEELCEYIAASPAPRNEEIENSKLLRKLLPVPLPVIEHDVTLGDYLRHLYEDDRLMDVRINVQGRQFWAHRIVLCCFSKYFIKHFQTQPQRQIPFAVTLNGISAEAFATFLEFLYTGGLSVYPEVASDLLKIADMLEVPVLQEEKQTIMQKLTAEEIVKVVVRDGERSVGWMITSVLDNFSTASKVPVFLNIDPQTLCMLLESDKLNVQSELEAFQIAVRWIVHNTELGVREAPAILQRIRFCHMTFEELLNCLDNVNFLVEDQTFRYLILEACWRIMLRLTGRMDPLHIDCPPPRNYVQSNVTNHAATLCRPPQVTTETHEKTPNETLDRCDTVIQGNNCEMSPKPVTPEVVSDHYGKPVMMSPTIRSMVTPPPITDHYGKPVMMSPTIRSMVTPPPIKVDIYILGGLDLQEASVQEQESQNSSSAWRPSCKLPVPRRHHAVAALLGHVYLTGGYDPETSTASHPEPTDTVHKMDLKTKQWVALPDMKESRMLHCACAANGRIYVFGGIGIYNTVLNSVECFQPRTNQWTHVIPLPTARYGAAAAVMGGTIYVVGGVGQGSGLNVLDDVESYDTLNKTWNIEIPLLFPRCHVGLASVAGSLYVIGGATSVNGVTLKSMTSVHEYANDAMGWKHIADMTTARHCFGMTSAGRRIYIIGGINSSRGTEIVLQSGECFDTRNGTWISGTKQLPVPVRSFSCVSVSSQ